MLTMTAILFVVSAGNCPTIEEKVEYKLPHHYKEVNSSSTDDCCNACCQESKCQSWSFKASDIPKGISCRLLPGIPTQKKNDSAFSSGLSGPAPPTPVPPPTPAPLRLKVKGSQLLDPSGNPIRLVGFNWQLGRIRDNEGAIMKNILPGSNVARVVGVLWDNSNSKSDCMTNVSPYFKDDCFTKLDYTIQQATDAGVWVILTTRSEIGAGQNYDTDPMSDVFHNITLRNMMYTMWGHVANHYKSWDRIAAYEIMSEPRDKKATPTQVRDFYAGGCKATQAVDPSTPCMVGSTPYYKLWTFNSDVIIPDNPNVIYTFDYFDPDDWAFGRDSVPQYPGIYPCSTLFPGWTGRCCPGGQGNINITFNASWNNNQFSKFALPVRDTFNVPIFVNQWGVVHGVSAEQGRYEYMKDVTALLKNLDIGWTWWTWRGGGGTGWAHGSFEILYDYSNGTVGQDTQAIKAVKPWM